MKKIELEIIAITQSIAQSNSYAVVLGEVNGHRRLPIVIGGFEAQAIAVALERINPTRPLTHDLMKNFLLAFNVDLHEVVINDFRAAGGRAIHHKGDAYDVIKQLDAHLDELYYETTVSS